MKINFGKSVIVPLNVDDELVQSLAQIWKCKVGTMPFTYIGLPMGTTRPTVTDLMPIVERAERKLSSALCMMNQGSKLTLLNSMITSIMIFLMCTLKFPLKLIEHLDKIRRRCLWRKKNEKVKYAIPWLRGTWYAVQKIEEDWEFWTSKYRI